MVLVKTHPDVTGNDENGPKGTRQCCKRVELRGTCKCPLLFVGWTTGNGFRWKSNENFAGVSGADRVLQCGLSKDTTESVNHWMMCSD